MSSKCPPARKQLLARWTGFQQKDLPFVYLGSNLFKLKGKKEHFQQLVDKMRRKLAGWKNKFLSAEGRYVMAAIPLYMFPV